MADLVDAGFQASQLGEHVLDVARFVHPRHAGAPLDAQYRAFVLGQFAQPSEVDLVAAPQCRTDIRRVDRAGQQDQCREDGMERAGKKSAAGVGGGRGL